MTDLRQAVEMALEALNQATGMCAERTSTRKDIDEAITALRTALDHVSDTMKMLEPEELVCVCGAIWQGQEMICPPRRSDEGIEREMPTDRGAWADVSDATKWVDELRGDEEPPTSTTDVVEPVVWVNADNLQGLTLGHFGYAEIYTDETQGRIPLYTAPPKREWQGLTNEELYEIVNKKWWDWEDTFDIEGFSRAVGAKLKEKNT